MEKEFKIGDEVWYFGPYDALRHGIITDMQGKYVKIKDETVVGGTILENCYATKEECCKAENEKNEARKAKYRESIKTIKQLVRFLWQHDIHSEFPDYEAREVAKEKAREFGIRLD